MAELVRTTVETFPDFPNGLKVFSAHPAAAEYASTPIIIDMAGNGYGALVKLSLVEARMVRDGLIREITAMEEENDG